MHWITSRLAYDLRHNHGVHTPRPRSVVAGREGYMIYIGTLIVILIRIT